MLNIPENKSTWFSQFSLEIIHIPGAVKGCLLLGGCWPKIYWDSRRIDGQITKTDGYDPEKLLDCVFISTMHINTFGMLIPN